MKVETTALDGVVQLTPDRYADDRGWFSESWNRAKLAEAGITLDWVQDNESYSAAAGTLRGIHFQIEPSAQDKLVRVVSGRIFDVAVDLRRSSPTFGNWVGVELTSELGNQLLVPAGFGHGFATLSPDCHVAYKASGLYDKSCDRAVKWDDPDIGIAWPIEADQVKLSAKDLAAPALADAEQLFD